MKFNSGLAEGIERVLELSVEAHVKRCEVAIDSSEFHNLTGAIAAYGKVLAMLTALQQGEEFYEMFAQHPSERVAA